jgi:hydroxyisourate hydrolase
MSHVTTHILDTALGKPAAGVNVVLESQSPGGWQLLSRGITDNNGRIMNLIPDERKLNPGIYRLIFDSKSYFFSLHTKTFYPAIYIDFEITDDSHYHVPLLLSPWGYSTYRGS